MAWHGMACMRTDSLSSQLTGRLAAPTARADKPSSRAHGKSGRARRRRRIRAMEAASYVSICLLLLRPASPVSPSASACACTCACATRLYAMGRPGHGPPHVGRTFHTSEVTSLEFRAGRSTHLRPIDFFIPHICPSRYGILGTPSSEEPNLSTLSIRQHKAGCLSKTRGFTNE